MNHVGGVKRYESDRLALGIAIVAHPIPSITGLTNEGPAVAPNLYITVLFGLAP